MKVKGAAEANKTCEDRRQNKGKLTEGKPTFLPSYLSQSILILGMGQEAKARQRAAARGQSSQRSFKENSQRAGEIN